MQSTPLWNELRSVRITLSRFTHLLHQWEYSYGSILWMFPGLAKHHAKIKQGTRQNPPPRGRSRQESFVQDEYRWPEPCLGSVLKGGGRGGGAKLPAAGHGWQGSWAGISEEEVCSVERTVACYMLTAEWRPTKNSTTIYEYLRTFSGQFPHLLLYQVKEPTTNTDITVKLLVKLKIKRWDLTPVFSLGSLSVSTLQMFDVFQHKSVGRVNRMQWQQNVSVLGFTCLSGELITHPLGEEKIKTVKQWWGFIHHEVPFIFNI